MMIIFFFGGGGGGGALKTCNGNIFILPLTCIHVNEIGHSQVLIS